VCTPVVWQLFVGVIAKFADEPAYLGYGVKFHVAEFVLPQLFVALTYHWALKPHHEELLYSLNLKSTYLFVSASKLSHVEPFQ
jgi:hypothetical protein